MTSASSGIGHASGYRALARNEQPTWAFPVDWLLQLRQRLDRLPPKSPERAIQIAAVAGLYGVSATNVYRALQAFKKPHAAHRANYGKPRMLLQAELKRYCALIAELKLRTTNKAGRHRIT
ncbi:hypothetical protein [Glaciimonas immobilis]|uniref:Uncharacterized protein n=1 Tax=Glaciimonas immobilis TaxID=728004 RepID=A0A840RN31_9BURK|nr:hypothetical protein [Glaciimonas immobilis]MBB5199095.1 hypothetical protein [Glaciimonas immobilis]